MQESGQDVKGGLSVAARLLMCAQGHQGIAFPHVKKHTDASFCSNHADQELLLLLLQATSHCALVHAVCIRWVGTSGWAAGLKHHSHIAHARAKNASHLCCCLPFMVAVRIGQGSESAVRELLLPELAKVRTKHSRADNQKIVTASCSCHGNCPTTASCKGSKQRC